MCTNMQAKNSEQGKSSGFTCLTEPTLQARLSRLPRVLSESKERIQRNLPAYTASAQPPAVKSVSNLPQANSVNLDIKRVVAYRHWCNKLWNAVRFAHGHLGPDFQPSQQQQLQLDARQLPLACRWILSRLNAATQATVTAMHAYQFADATQVSCWPFQAQGHCKAVLWWCIDGCRVLKRSCPQLRGVSGAWSGRLHSDSEPRISCL